MNQTIKILTEHRSYRNFKKNQQLPTEHLSAILNATRQAPSFENGQFYSIVRLTDKTIRKKLVTMNPNNPQLADCSEALLFVADLKRTQIISQKNQTNYDVTNNYDALLTATTDASLACENAVIASESLGYGTIIVGGIRRNNLEIIELCHLPEYTLPLFVLCIGNAKDTPNIKPRLPKEVVIFENIYESIDYSQIQDYDRTIKNFRDTGIDQPWTQKFLSYFQKNKLSITNDVLKKQKFIQ